jgi:D-alanine--poly(phosphoribitol) ligase subunit 1
MIALRRKIYENLTQLGDAPAILLGRKGALSYAGLSQWVSSIQHAIAEDHQTIGILASRSAPAYAAVLACFLAGKRFVPLNPDFPLARLNKLVSVSGIDVLLFDPKAAEIAKLLFDTRIDLSALKEKPINGASLQLEKEINDAEICYQLFTSGSTGEPKGVPISYASLDHYISNIKDVLKPATGARFSQLFDLTFDLSMHDIFLCFSTGGELIPAGQMDILMPHLYIEKKKIDYWFSVPMLALAANRGLEGKPPGHKLTSAAFCGEALPEAYASNFKVFLRPDARLWNLYGPTEATIAFTACLHPDAGYELSTVPLGTPFGNNVIAIETEDGRIVDCIDGAEGELLLSGPQVFKGYEPTVQKACFTDATGRYYRSGDQVRMRDGLLEHLGRIDDQVKIRGFRIELGDIESVFRAQYSCGAAVAVVLGEMERATIAVAYTAEQDIENLDSLADVLPDYMQPKLAKRIDVVPINANGKVNRSAIRDMLK